MKLAKKSLNTAQIAIIMVVVTALAKVLGLVRELLLAHFYGAGVIIDSYSMAQDIPDTVFATVIQLVGTAFLPIYSRKAENNGKLEGDRFTSQVYNFLLMATAVMIVICILFPGFFVKLFAPGFSQEAVNLTKYYLRIAVFMLVGHVTITVFEPYLRYNDSYLLPVIFGFFQSVFVIAFTYISFLTKPELLIYGVPIGVILQGVVLVWFAMKSKGYKYTPSFKYSDSVKEVFVLAMPILFSSLAFRLNSFFDRMLASGFEAGSISALRYGHLLLGLISAFSYNLIATVAYPKFNKLVAQNDYDGLSKMSGESIDYSSLLTIPITLGCMLFTTPIVRLIFERGAFDASATAVTSSVFFWYALSLPFNGAILLIGYVFYSLQDIKPTVYCSIISVAVNAVLNFVLSYFIGVQGLALATTISAIVHMLTLIVWFLKRHPDIRLLSSFKNTIFITLGSIISVGAAYIVFKLLGDSILNFVISVIIAIVLYLVAIIAFRVITPNMVKETLNFRNKQKD